MNEPRPLALAVLWVSRRTSQDTRQRLRYELAQAVNAEGYALLDLFEVGGDNDEAVYETISARSGRGDVQALVIRGAGDGPEVGRIADRHRLRIVRVTGPASKGTGGT